jgi:hypothetical protein
METKKVQMELEELKGKHGSQNWQNYVQVNASSENCPPHQESLVPVILLMAPDLFLEYVCSP